MKTLIYITITIASIILTSCNSAKNTGEAEKAVKEFHVLFDAKEFEKIYNTAHADFKASQPKEHTIDFLRSLRENLGIVKSTKRTGWRVSSFDMKTNVILKFSTVFENAKGSETFTYRIVDGNAVLLGWNVNY